MSMQQTLPFDGEPGLANLPAEFWEARTYLHQIREGAHARGASADVVFNTALARIAAQVPHTARVETGIGVPASLNLFVAIVDTSGAGKSSDYSVTKNLIANRDDIELEDLPLGSGEGIAEAYMGEVEEPVELDPNTPGRRRTPKTKTVRRQVRHNAFLLADEGTAMTELMAGRKGSTLGSTLRTAWTGGTLGNANASKDRYRVIPEASYSLGMVVGFQRATAAPLLADVRAGTPQRFLWVSATDPTVPKKQPPHAVHRVIWDWSVFSGHLSVAASIRGRLWDERRAKKAGELVVPQLDSHKPLMLVKVAGLLAILDKRTDITEEDWTLATVVWDTSAAVRADLLEHVKGLAREQRNAADETHARRAVLAQERVTEAQDKETYRVAKLVATHVHADGQLTRGAINRRLPDRDRPWLDKALDYAEGLDWVARDGKQVLPGTSKPADEA